MNEKGGKSAAAIKCIYTLCNFGHKHNRLPMVCSGKWDVLTPLAKCLTYENGDERLHACLTLNNLSIPIENKRVMALGPSSKAIIEGLCKIIAEGKKESYLGCICLMNLAFLEASITTILQHSPVASGKDDIAPLLNPNSLLRILEKLLTNSSTNEKSGSAKWEGVRWACGLIKNLAKDKENAILIGQTDIPKYIVNILQCTTFTPHPAPVPSLRTSISFESFSLWANGLIKNLSKAEENTPLMKQTDSPKYVLENNCATSTALSQWTSNSIEDFSLYIILNLAQWPVVKEVLVNINAIDIVKPIMAHGNLQGLKATMACALLGVPWTSFPDGGSSAGQIVSELMTHIIKKKGKHGQYADGVFKLHTATKAFCDLTIAAKNADRTGSVANIKSLALPSTVALIFQIVSDHVLFAIDDAKVDSKFVPDIVSAEHAVGAIHTMLPAILQVNKESHMSLQSKKACCEVSQMLLAFSKIPGTTAEAEHMSKAVADEITNALNTSCPILETSLALWTQNRTDDKTKEIV